MKPMYYSKEREVELLEVGFNQLHEKHKFKF